MSETMTSRMQAALEKAFAPTELVVADVSENHRGHAGYRDGGESHFDVKIRSAHFADMNRLARHRAVHAALGADIITQIHALSLDIETP